MSANVRRTRPNAVADLIRFTKMIEKKAAYVGYPAGVGGELVKRAAIHQFGSVEKNIPPRPFLSEGVQNGVERYRKVAKNRLKPILQGRTSVAEYHNLQGQIATAEVVKHIRQGTFAPLSPITIKRKGSSKPLIDTSQMLDSVTWEVRNND